MSHEIMKPSSANVPTLARCVGYKLDIAAAPPTGRDLSRLRNIYLSMGVGCAAAACAFTALLFETLPTPPGELFLALILLDATSIACAGLALAAGWKTTSPVAAGGQPDFDAVELACHASPAAMAYRAAVLAQERPLTMIEAEAMLAAAGYRYVIDAQDIPRLERVHQPPMSALK